MGAPEWRAIAWWKRWQARNGARDGAATRLRDERVADTQRPRTELGYNVDGLQRLSEESVRERDFHEAIRDVLARGECSVVGRVANLLQISRSVRKL